MSRKQGKKNINRISVCVLLFLVVVVSIVNVISEFVLENKERVIMVCVGIVVLIIVLLVIKSIVNHQRSELLKEILQNLHLEMIDSQLKEYDDQVIVKSRQSLENYTDIKYFKEHDILGLVQQKAKTRKNIKDSLYFFLKDNNYQNRPQYGYVREQLVNYMQMLDGYRVLITYITSAGNNRGQRILHVNEARIKELTEHPEYLMTKGEYNKFLKQKAKEELNAKKHSLYGRVNEIIDFANESKEMFIVKNQVKVLDELVQKLFDKTINGIQKVSTIDSDEWGMFENYISTIGNQIQELVKNDNRIRDYYESESFSKIKETCSLLTQSQRDFNNYINEKTQLITRLFGTRIVRNETKNEDTYNYLRPYKKSITPFTAEVSSAVFGSAENNPIGYIIKYFYPNKSQYKVQIEKLRVLIEELETLKEAQGIIENYKKDYQQYIKDVPKFVMDNDEDGFYSRLGLATINESVLNVEYRFIYTSDGGMAQRSFTVPMNEENIVELINQLESKLSLDVLVKEQRALMTNKLRRYIKERDNYTCCQCGNSIYTEPNLLLEIDHIIPISKGGLTQEDNLQTLCWKCNRKKGAKLSF